MEEIIIPVVIVSIIQIVLIILFVQATMNIKKIYDLLYIERQEKIEAKKKEAQPEQGNQNSEPQSLAEIGEQKNGMDAVSVILIGVAILVIFIILLYTLSD